MKLICPICQSKFTYDQARTWTLAWGMTPLAAKFGRAWPLADEYVDSFQQGRYSGVTLKQRIRVLKELLTLWEAKEFFYDGRHYRTDHARIAAGLKIVCNAEKHGFVNHNYLKKILLETADLLSAEGLTAAEEQAREEARRRRRPREDVTREESRRDLEKFKLEHGVSSITDLIGLQKGDPPDAT